MKTKTTHVCQQCGHNQGKWAGKCPNCGEWNSLIEEQIVDGPKGRSRSAASENNPIPVGEVRLDDVERIRSSCQEFDNVLGGGLVPGSVVLIGGEPGVGKSTLLLQQAADYAKPDSKVLYASGEESCGQIGLRANRLHIKTNDLLLISETGIEAIEQSVQKIKPGILVIDSIQTLQSQDVLSQPGSVSQLRDCTQRIVSFAKSRNLSVFIVGHVTKEGQIAGPKLLEHMVDVVLYFEGSKTHSFRLLRTVKNRFGSTNEIGVYEMSHKGIQGVNNPSELFLAERQESISGSAISACVEGTRPLLVEVQSLVSSSQMAMPRRTAIGTDPNRIALLVAILEKRAGFKLFDQEVYVNLAGGLKVYEPAADLAIVASLISSFQGKALESDCVYFGEVGLGGEVRSVPRSDIRIKEAQKIGFKRAFVPEKVADQLASEFQGIELVPVKHIGMLTDYI